MERYSVSKHDVKVISWIFLPGSGRTTGNKTEKAAQQFQQSLPNWRNSVVKDVSAVKYQRAPNKNKNKDLVVE